MFDFFLSSLRRCLSWRHCLRFASYFLLSIHYSPAARGEIGVAYSSEFAVDIHTDSNSSLEFSPIFQIDTRERINEGTAASGLFVVDTHLSGSFGQFASANFTVNTLDQPPANVAISGFVLSRYGAPISAALVEAIQGNLIRVSTTTDAAGSYQLTLTARTYDLRARIDGWLTVTHPINLSPSQSVQRNFVLDPRPSDPTVTTTTDPPESTQIVTRQPASTDQLQLFRNDIFVPRIALDPGKMTIVLTHGWNSDPDEWAVEMARALVNDGVNANIVAWDWHEVAQWRLDAPARTTPSIISQETPSQGLALGRALYETLQAGYTKPLHFIGHSLGTLVNAAAVNYLQGDTPGERPAVCWSDPLRIHVTLLDDAGVASGLDPGTVFVLGTFARSLPRQAVWADNYLSLIGDVHDNAVNVYLRRSRNFDILTAHGYPCDWYTWSISDTAVRMGNRYSFEKMGESARFPARSSAFNFLQNESLLADRMDLQSIDRGALRLLVALDRATSPTGIFLGTVATGIGVVQVAGEVGATVVETTVDVLEATGDVIIDGTTRVVNTFGVAIRFVVARVRPPPPGEFGILGATGPAYARLSVDVPVGASSLMFDFAVEGDGAEDFLVAGINGTNVFALETKFIPANEILTSGSIDVSAYQGQTIELFFGLLGGTSVDAAATVQSIRFYTTTPPSLGVTTVGGEAILTWPAWATHYSLEATPSLEQPDWQMVPELPVIEGEEQTLRLPAAGSARFFRLRL